MFLCILILNFWIANWKTKDSAPNDSKHSLISFDLNFFLNRILICFQIFELFPPFKGTIINLHAVTKATGLRI